MKSYLRDFLEEFQFPDEAKTQLLSVYDELCKKDGKNLFSDCINEYRNGALLTYSLNLFGLDDGFTMNIIGEKGRMEFSNFSAKDKYKIIVRYRDLRVDEITFPIASGDHAGGDDRMRDMLFGYVTEDPLGQCADSFAGVKSVMIGVAANKSIKEGVRVELTPILDKMR